MAGILTTRANYCAAGAAKTLITGAGRLLSIIATTTSATAVTITIYDNTAGSGNILMTLNLTASYPLVIFWPHGYEPRVSTGLTLSLPADTTCHCATLAG